MRLPRLQALAALSALRICMEYPALMTLNVFARIRKFRQSVDGHLESNIGTQVNNRCYRLLARRLK